VGPKFSEVFDTFWTFAANRQAIFFQRVKDQAEPWTQDPVLQQFKFTNAYRAQDRVTQFLIRQVIPEDKKDAKNVFFRVLLFKIFNKIETWLFLESHFGQITWDGYSFAEYARALDAAKALNGTLYSAAYIMPPGGDILGFTEKHKSHLRLLEMMISDGLPDRLASAKSMQEAFELVLAYPTIGPFLAFQYTIDLNYSDLTDFSEMSFVVAGPGAKRGLRKCFTDPGDFDEADLIRLVADSQQKEFERRGLRFQNLWGRDLQLIDCQNLFCEVDKYSRVAHPELNVGQCRIKQRFHSSGPLPRCRFPEKWQINDAVDDWYDALASG
jgi:hypothetical protein